MADLIPWQESLGNKFTITPSEAFLTENHVTIRRGNRIGESKYNHAGLRQWRYDRDYVVNWLAVKFFNNFPNVPWNELQTMLSEAYKLSKKQAREKT